MTYHSIGDGQSIPDGSLDANAAAAAAELAQTLRRGAVSVAGLAGTGALGPAAGRAGDVALVLAGWQGPLQVQFRLAAATEAAKAVAVEQAMRAEADAWERMAANSASSQIQSDRPSRSAETQTSGGRFSLM